MFEFDYTITEKEYIDFNCYHAIHSPAGKKTLLILFLVMPTIFLIQLIFDVSSGRTEYIVGKAVLFAAYSGVWALILKPLMLLSVRVNTLLLKKNGKLPYDSQVELKFDEEFIYEKTSLTEIKMSYAKLERIAVGKTGVYLYHTVLSAFVIPNNVFANEAQRYDFLQLIHQKTNLPIVGIL